MRKYTKKKISIQEEKWIRKVTPLIKEQMEQDKYANYKAIYGNKEVCTK